MAHRFACQTITFGPDQWKDFPAVFAAVRQAGYDGVEIGYRHLANHPAATIRQMLDAAGLEIVGAHIGGNLEDLAQAAGEQKTIDAVLDYMLALGVKRLMYSGLRFNDEAQFQNDFAMVKRSAQRCAERGVEFLYHNHNWEFAGGGRAIESLIDDGGPGLRFCPDVGWVQKAGVAVVPFLDRIRSRIGAIHYKDFATMEGKGDTCLLGAGITPFPEISAWLRQNLPNVWVIAEQDRAEGPAAQAVAANVAYMKRVVSGEGGGCCCGGRGCR